MNLTVRLVAIAVLLTSAMFNRYTIEVLGATMKPEHLALIGVWLVLVLGRLRWGWRLGARPLIWLVPFAVTLFLSSLLNAPDRAASFRQAAMVVLVASGAWAVYCLAATPPILRKAVQMVCVLGVVETVAAFAALIADRFGYTFGTQPGNGYIRVPFATLWEPNVLGSYLAASAMLVLSALLAEPKGRNVLWWAACLGLMTAAVGLSLARASWLALPVGALVVVLLYWRAQGVPDGFARNLRFAIVAAVLALVFLVTVAFFVFPQTFQGILVRVDIRWYQPSRDPALQERATQYTVALQGIAEHPFIGNGAGSFGSTHSDEHGQPGWISNLELHLLYDSGLIGLFSVLGGLAALMWGALRELLSIKSYRPTDQAEGTRTVTEVTEWVGLWPHLRPQAIGLIAALIVLLITFQTTEATWLAFTWPYIGLLARVANARQGNS